MGGGGRSGRCACNAHCARFFAIYNFIADIPKGWFEPLYAGASITIFEHLVSMFTFLARHGWGVQETTDILGLIKAHLPADAKVCTSHHVLLKSFANAVGQPGDRHYMCPECRVDVEEDAVQCPQGHRFLKPNFFLTMDVAGEVRLRLKGTCVH